MLTRRRVGVGWAGGNIPFFNRPPGMDGIGAVAAGVEDVVFGEGVSASQAKAVAREDSR